MTPSQKKPLVVTINSNGRQAASFIRVASAVGWRVRGHFYRTEGPTDVVARELHDLSNVTLIEGRLEDKKFVSSLFQGADLAFINTTHWGDEVAIGCFLADTAKRAGIKHYVYSSMPDHSTFDSRWKALPLWAHKFTAEKYIRSLGIPCSFVYTGIYNNNFTSLPYPLFRMELQSDGSFVWQAPFHPDDKLPWLDAEHDVGPALLQIFKEGPARWNGHRPKPRDLCFPLLDGVIVPKSKNDALIPIAFEKLNPKEVCAAFSRGVGRPVKYRRGPIEWHVKVPQGYYEHLQALQDVLGVERAPYFGPTMYWPHEAIQLWEGNRGMEEYAREVFPEEEAANGLTWMEDNDDEDDNETEEGDEEDTRSSVTGAEKEYTTSC